MSEPIYERVWDAFERHVHLGHYHDPQTAATPATEAPDMSVLTTLETDFEDVRAKVENFAKDKLPAALADAKKLEGLAGNPVIDALLGAVHVPAEALSMAVSVINKLEDLYKPESDSQAPAVAADPAMGSQPEPAPSAS